MRAIRLGLLLFVLTAGTSYAAEDLTIKISGSPSIVFNSRVDGCAPIDVPDVNPRAFRDASGQIVMFALHYVNRPLRGPDFAHLKIDCHAALDSAHDADPAKYADRSYITATWTRDGRTIGALVHHEYHADDHSRCKVSSSLGCWYNSILSYRSTDDGLDFSRVDPAIVAAAPFRQDVEQGRHRGFFNPSNIFADGRHFYAFISTTGWHGQAAGSCLFRTDDPSKPGSWRAYDGKAFSVRYDDPYGTKATRPTACRTIDPFLFPVGTVVRHRASKSWIALFQAPANDTFPLDGIYYATSADLLSWSAPKILLAGKTLYSDLCKAGPSIINYPSMIDPASSSRNFDEVCDHPDLFLTTMDVENCHTGTRILVREPLTIHRGPPS